MQRQFNKDELLTLAIEMDLPTLLNFCRVNKKINKEICENDLVWQRRLIKEFPDYNKLKEKKKNKEIYAILYQLSKLKEKLQLMGSIYDIYKLEKLSATFKRIKNIPKEIGVLVNLKELYLNNNQIIEIPKEIGNLRNLQQLWIGQNQIKEIPKEIGKLKKLRLIDFQNNKIEIVPKELADIPKLQNLNLSFNPIVKFPEELKRKIEDDNIEFTIFNHQHSLKNFPEIVK